MTKREKIRQLKQRVAELEARIQALEARPLFSQPVFALQVVPYQPYTPFPAIDPYPQTPSPSRIWPILGGGTYV